MSALRLQRPGETRRYAQSWVFSLLLHGLAVSAAIAMVADLKLAPQPDPFKWDVALVDTPVPKQVDTPSPPVAKPEPVKPAPTPKRSPEKQVPMQKAQPVQTVQQVVRQQQVMQVQPIEHVSVPSTQQSAQRMNEMVTRPTQSIEVPQQTVPPATEMNTPTETRQVVHESAVATAEPQRIVQETNKPATETHQVTDTAAAALEPQPLMRETASPVIETRQIVQEAPAMAPSQSLTQQVMTETAPVISAESSVISKSVVETPAQQQASPVVQEHAMVKEHPVARHMPVRPIPATKTDYGWLAEALWHKVEQLKRYPAMARMNRWEGKVVLRAVIRDTGELVDLEVAESSGHAVLDRDALEVMKRASPITLKHSLGQSQVVLQIPISYKLK
jgi:protein TonB